MANYCVWGAIRVIREILAFALGTPYKMRVIANDAGDWANVWLDLGSIIEGFANWWGCVSEAWCN